MPCGRPMGRPAPASTPPVSEFESPKLIIRGLDAEIPTSIQTHDNNRITLFISIISF
ncbi:hypothetical protein HanXRQr2_Chr06g0243671 [Helianthus annuus]|uniref:Uncharacterized protein n=1 Tax=Helianthus annuus TaxID=4232 RepID=A0A9K3NIQ5_HELAN|nr:hypothetical protein HanXRQr2_Chr06g0243671 [Helianthus annuus]